ncbi:MAG: flagellar motor switch protein FliM [Armatimonadetes bacterium]|nr:flagellar motor switch protein FliM [Armatimonadota bacterium]
MDGMLSQDEVDALLAQAAAAAASGGSIDKIEAEREVKLYDFKRPEKFSREQLRNLERLHERFARLLSTSLSAYIRTNIIVKIESVTPLSYQEFIYSLPQPTLIHVIELEPLPGQAALEMTPTVVFPMYEQMLGAKHRMGSRIRQLTDVELVLFQRPLERMMQALAETWQDFVRLRPRLVRVEQDPQFAQVAATNTPVVVVSLEVTIGEDFGMMSLCMPDVLVDALLHSLGQERIPTDKVTAVRDEQLVREVLTPLGLPVIAELGRTEMSLRQVRELQPDDVIKLGTRTDDDLPVYIGDQLLFRGRVGQRRRHLAVQLTDKVEPPSPFDELRAEPVAEPSDETEKGTP